MCLRIWINIMKSKYVEELRYELSLQNENETDIEAACKYAQNLENLGLPIIFDKAHFSHLLGIKCEEISKMMASLENNYYHSAIIQKKSGGERTLDIPAVELRNIQRWILDHILVKLHISQYATGFCKNKSIVTNALPHVGKKCIVNMDLKDFFPSVSQKQVFNIFYYYGYTIGISYMLSRLCTLDGKLPQGAPTSPMLSNIICLKLDKRLSELAKRFSATYTRYADDITFSGDTDLSILVPIVEKIILEEGFQINEKKTRVLFEHQRQEVTGLLVNGENVRVKKKYLKKMRQEIYYCKKYGVDDHLKHIHCEKRFYREHMYGKAYFINMVNQELGQELIQELNEINWD